MAATDSTANSKPGSEKKPGADQPADKKVASDAAALAKKLYDDSHPAAAKPVSKPTTPEAAQSHGIMGWLSDTEKSASAALSNAANSLKQEAKADLKTVSAIANSVAAKGDSVVAQFGALTISGIEDVKHAVGIESKPADKKAHDGSTNKSSTELAGAANKQAQSEKQAVPAAPADASAPATKDASGAPAPAADATVGSGLLSSLTDAVSSVASYVGSTVKSGLDSIMSKDTQDALLNAAELYGPGALGVVGVAGVAGVAVAGAAELAGAPLPTMVGMAGTAYKNYLNDFKDGEFDKSAQHVDSFDNVSFASLDKSASADRLATQKSDDALLTNSATWFIAGDSKPGGTALIARTGNETTAEGTTKDNIAYSASSTPDKQSAKVGAMDVVHTADGGVSIGNVDYTMTVKPPLTILESKDKQQKITYNALTHERTLLDKKIGYKIKQNADGVITEKNGKAYVQVAAGSTMDKAMQDAAKNAGSKIIFATDNNGDRGAFGQNGTSYVLLAKSHQLVVTKDQFKLVLDTLSAKAQLYELDPKTKQFVLTKPDPKTLPKGWVINGDSVQIDGQSLKNQGEHFVHVLGAVFDLDKAKITDPTKTGDVVLSSDGTNTHLSGAGVPKIDTTPTGKVTIASPGEAPIVIDPVKGLTVANPDGTVATIEVSGAAKLVDGKTHQEADIDPRGNETSYNDKHQQIFSMNNQGDMRLADGTNIYHTGAVYNPSRNIYEPSYNGKTAGEVIHDAVSLSSYVGGSLGGSIASLESTLAMLDSLGDIPGLAEQIGAAKENIQAQIAEAKDKEYLNATLSQAGKGTDTIEKALLMRGSGLSDQDIAERMSKPQDFAASGMNGA